MTRTDPLAGVGTRKTPQTQRIPGATGNRQVKNNAGGFVFETSDDARLHRFLTIGVEGGTYYQKAPVLARENAEVIFRMVAAHRGQEVVDKVIQISEAGRAPKQQPGLFALAVVARTGNDDERAAAFAAVRRVCRTFTTLAQFVNYCEQFGGWGNGFMKSISRWYTEQDVDRVAYQAIKYRQRDGWTHRDIMRKSHPGRWSTLTDPQHALYSWITHPDGAISDEAVALRSSLPAIVGAFEEAQAATTITKWVSLIEEHNLPWEALPDSALSEPKVWATMIARGMPQTALMRQLPRLTRLDVFSDNGIRKMVADQLQDPARLTKGRVHPLNVLVAQKTYAQGRSMQGSSTWTPVRQITDALDAAFYNAYGAVEPANKRTLIALDVSGSMSSPAGGLPISAREVAAALALVIMSTEPDSEVIGFSAASNTYHDPGMSRYDRYHFGLGSRGADLNRNGVSELDISPRRRLDDVVRSIEMLPFNGTDCALPMIWAGERAKVFDTFIVVTDSETWHGSVHPTQALQAYREHFNPNARQVVVATTSTGFTIADPNDPGALDVAGFDSAVPNLINDFSRGDV